MNVSAPQSRVRLFQWAAALLLPNLILAWWWFRQVPPYAYLAQIYALELPLALRFPAISVCLSAIAAAVVKKRLEAKQEINPKEGVSFAVSAVAIASAMMLCAGAIFGSGFLLNVFHAAIGIAILLAATSFGLCALEVLRLTRSRFDSPIERLVLSAALGLGAFALMMFIGGTLSFLNAWPWWLLMVVLIATGAQLLRRLFLDLHSSAREMTRAHPAAVALLCFITLWCAAHALLIWSPPVEYDVLEYHLAAPAEYLRNGRVSFLHHNLYATMPENGEMLYLLSMVVSGGKSSGLPAAHLVLLSTWILSICGVYALSSRILRRLHSPDDGYFSGANTGAAIGAALFAITPLATQVAADFYVEHIQSLFHLGALMAACAFLGERRTNSQQRFDWLVLAGLLAGFACGTKYPAMLFTVLPLLVLLPLFCWRGGSLFEGIRAALTVGVSALIAFAPWLLRNFLVADDPIHPLGLVMKRRVGAQSSADHLTHFDVATRAGERSFSALVNVLRKTWPGFTPAGAHEQPMKHFLVDAENNPALLFFAIPGFIRAIRGELLFVALVFALDVALWFFFTYRLNRFFYTLLAPLAVISAIGAAQIWLIQPLRQVAVTFAVAGILLFAPLSMIYVWLLSTPGRVSAAETFEETASAQFQAFGTGQWFEAWQRINALPDSARVLFIGDAQTFYLEQNPEYAVVFNPQLLEAVVPASRNGAAAAQSLLARGITHIYISYSEWFRLDTSYAIVRPGTDGDWQQIKWGERQRAKMRELLSNGQYDAYRREWPTGAQPAYLKLSAEDYAKLETLVRDFTVIEQAWQNSSGRTSCELRRLMPAQ